MTPTIWTGCYAHGWGKDDLVEAAFSHPAKVAKGLAFSLIQHLVHQGYVCHGAVVLDPFAGIGGFCLSAVAHGLQFVGVELEPKFHAIAQENLALWQRRYGFTGAQILQGDSRQLRAVLAGALVGACVGSPPYVETIHATQHGIDWTKKSASTGNRRRGEGTRNEETLCAQLSYGTSPGQLGALPVGSLAAVLSSPPYADSWHSAESTAVSEERMRRAGYSDEYIARQFRASKAAGGNLNAQGYGPHPANLGNLPTGAVEAVVSSPPYGAVGMQASSPTVDTPPRPGDVRQYARKAPIREYGTTPGQLAHLPMGACVSSPPYAEGLSKEHTYSDHGKRDKDSHRRIMIEKGIVDPFYGTSPGQLGNGPTTFWEASSQIMAEVAALLPPGAVCAWVLKDYIAKGKRVPFCAQWQALCEAHGFELVETIHASLVEQHGTQETLFGEAEDVTTARMSFFRRLHTKKYPHLAIEEEVVLILQKEAHA